VPRSGFRRQVSASVRQRDPGSSHLPAAGPL